ncbi:MULTISPECIES: type VI secretion system Vgr family protein [Serratia]|uniref:type VI secretion system Vgr family protein n=1 Tax=Serratia TaxID=613 RepID=UPI000B5DEC8A|nr:MULTISPECIES: type VI secretion system tip protein TssI/VgrG [Serratia]ASL83200.1 ImpA family type VI secretion-associated protein [Serratia marcescens]MBL0905441.1 type VI secretion system tip protein VgrG [Serratia bockelmannii]MDH7588461.1 type VI secretion system tip protein TssI/VgrG [Serratia bockelmannii]
MTSRISVQLPVEGLLFWKLAGREALSEPFALTLTLLGRDARINRSELLGQPVTVNLPTGLLSADRHINGKVTRVAVSAVELSGTRYAVYTLTVESDLWPMKRDRNLRIFQGQTVPQTVHALLSEYQVNVEDKLTCRYRVWDYCVQYQESSLDFISRLMELEGIVYHFRHEAGRHTLVLTDAAGQYQPFSGYETIPYHQTPSGGSTLEQGIGQWAPEDSVTPGIYGLDDYDFRKPNAWLFQARQNPASPMPGSIDVYDWPGRYVEHADGEFYARVRQERWQVEHQQVHGTATAIGIAPGYTFTLINAPFFSDNGEYLTTAADYTFSENRYASGEEGETIHRIDFTVIPAATVLRPLTVTPWPRTYGPQTAKVVGPVGENIWTDKYGRIKVKFHWDRRAKGDDTSSCWVRVSSAWAGQGFGSVQIPRVGDEVVVDFINGDPDRPIVTGRVYNEASMPPWVLPAAATQMGFMTRSKDGSRDNASYLFFEDKVGSEAVELHSEKDMKVSVENDQQVNIDGNRSTTILKQQQDEVTGNATFHYKSQRTTTVDKKETGYFNGGVATEIKAGRTFDIKDGGDKVTIKGDRTSDIDGNESHHVSGKLTETLDKGRDVTIGAGGHKENITGGVTREIKGGVNETIKDGVTTNINSGDWTQNVNAGTITIYSPHQIKIVSGEKISLEAPESVFNPKLHSLTVTAFSESITGNSVSASAIASSIVGVSNGLTGLSNSYKLKEFSKTAFKTETNGVVVNVEVTNISNRTLNVTNNSLFIIT